MRLDQKITFIGLTSTRSKAQYLIKTGQVMVNGKTINKSAFEVLDEDEITLTEKIKYVSHGGYKLESANSKFKISFNLKNILDIGASTGGFTDYALQNGAKKVITVDTGSAQLDGLIRKSKKVFSLENTDIRSLKTVQEFKSGADIVLIDVSFISLTKIIPTLSNFCHSKTKIIALVKPQFEMDSRKRFKNGIVPIHYHSKVLKKIKDVFAEHEFRIAKLCPTQADGKRENLEYFLLVNL